MAAAMMTAGIMAVAPAPAMAVPTDCDWGVAHDDDQSWALCKRGSGEFRARVKCDATWPTDNYWKSGPWVKVRSGTVNYIKSMAQCSHNDDAMKTGVETR